MSSGPAPPTAYELALTAIATTLQTATVEQASPESSVGDADADKDSDAKPSKDVVSGTPKIVFYRNDEEKGDIGRVSRKIEQIVLFTKAPPAQNNANSYTRPDFRAGLLAMYFNVEVKEAGGDAPFGDAPGIEIFDAKGEKIVSLNASQILSGKLVGTMNAILKNHGRNVYTTVLKASSILMKVYQIEIDIQKLQKRRPNKSITERIAFNTKVKNAGLEKYKELMSGS